MSSTGMNYCNREISKEQYERAMRNNGRLTDEDMEQVFTQAELCGYGIYSQRVSEGLYLKKGHYFVIYEIGESCD